MYINIISYKKYEQEPKCQISIVIVTNKSAKSKKNLALAILAGNHEKKDYLDVYVGLQTNNIILSKTSIWSTNAFVVLHSG